MNIWYWFGLALISYLHPLSMPNKSINQNGKSVFSVGWFCCCCCRQIPTFRNILNIYCDTLTLMKGYPIFVFFIAWLWSAFKKPSLGSLLIIRQRTSLVITNYTSCVISLSYDSLWHFLPLQYQFANFMLHWNNIMNPKRNQIFLLISQNKHPNSEMIVECSKWKLSICSY